MSEYGPVEQFPIITNASLFRITGDDIDRWRSYAWCATEYGSYYFGIFPESFIPIVKLHQNSILAMVQAFEAKRDADIAAWVKG